MKPKVNKTEKRKRRKRTLLKGSVKQVLENYFHQQPKPSLQEINWLASAVRMDQEVVKVWFCNRRNKEKQNRPPSKTQRRTRSASRIPTAEENTDGTAEQMNEPSAIISPTEELIELNGEVSYDLPLLVSVTSLADNDVETGSTSDSNDMPQIIPNDLLNSTASSDDIRLNTSSKSSGGLLKNTKPWSPLSCSPSVVKLGVSAAIRERSNLIGHSNGIDFYAIPFQKSSDSFSTFERYVYGKPDSLQENRTIVLFGSDRSSQTKFIDGMMNYIFNIQQEDEFRLQSTDQQTNQTNSIKMYRIHHTQEFRIPFGLTIVCMPIYEASNDSELFIGQEIAKTFLEFLKNRDGIQELDVICGTAIDHQSYLSIFGNDVEGIISSWQPSSCNWQDNMQNVFTLLAENKKKSLAMTVQVLEERKRMEAAVKGLQRLVQIGSCKMEEIDKAKQMIVFCQMQIESNDDEVEENNKSTRKTELPAGQYVNNCNYCHVTCHDSSVEPLALKYENNEGDCSSDYFETTVTGFCSFCPAKCNLNMHANQPYRWVPVKEEGGRRSDHSITDRRPETEIKWNDIKSKGRDLVKQLHRELIDNATGMLEHFQVTWRCIQRINAIAFRGNSFLTEKVFDALFNAEQQLKQLGFDEKLESLRH